MIRPNHSASDSESLALQLFGVVCVSFSAQCVSQTMHRSGSFRVFRAQDTSLCLECLEIEFFRFCVSRTPVESIRKIELRSAGWVIRIGKHDAIPNAVADLPDEDRVNEILA